MKHIVIDACLPEQIVAALRVFNQPDVFYLHDKFQEGAKDEYFIPHLAQNGWVLLTKDLAMGNGIGMTGPKSPQAKVLAAYRGMAFFLPKSFNHYRTLEQAWRVIKYWKKLRDTAEDMQPGDIYDVEEGGDVKLRSLQ